MSLFSFQVHNLTVEMGSTNNLFYNFLKNYQNIINKVIIINKKVDFKMEKSFCVLNKEMIRMGCFWFTFS